jgi:hypothetical protein
MDNVTYTPQKSLVSLLSKHTTRSKIEGVDILQYAVIAQWLCYRYGDVQNWFLPEEAIDWLRAESGFKEHQQVKATYVARLLVDYHANRSSAPCPEFRIVCQCGREASRTDSANHRYPMYRCSCGCAVGFHKGDGWPLGLMAAKEVRRWRSVLHATHERLCDLWNLTPKQGYVPLAKLLNVPLIRCHFSLVIDEGRAIEINNIMLQEIARLEKEKKLTGCNRNRQQLAMQMA